MEETLPGTIQSRKRAEEDLKSASHQLQCLLQKGQKDHEILAFPEFSPNGTPESAAAEFESALDRLISARVDSKRRLDRSEKLKAVAKRWIKATYPLTHILLGVLMEGSSVLQCVAILLMIDSCIKPLWNRLCRTSRNF